MVDGIDSSSSYVSFAFLDSIGDNILFGFRRWSPSKVGEFSNIDETRRVLIVFLFALVSCPER
jgi:hypothetical protein